jgi:hypothetical protein
VRHQYQNAHGNIGVRGPDGSYFDTVENFTADYGFPPPPLPEGVVDQLYEPGRRHAYGDGEGNVIGGGPAVWADGDSIIGMMESGLSAQKTRRAAEAKAREERLEAEAEVFRAEMKKRLEEEVKHVSL